MSPRDGLSLESSTHSSLVLFFLRSHSPTFSYLGAACGNYVEEGKGYFVFLEYRFQQSFQCLAAMYDDSDSEAEGSDSGVPDSKTRAETSRVYLESEIILCDVCLYFSANNGMGDEVAQCVY